MAKKYLFNITLLVVFSSKLVFAQTAVDRAAELGKQAIALEDKEDFNGAIKLLTQAQKLDPQSLTYPFESAYSYYGLKNYPQAISILNPLLSRKDATAKVYRVLGDCFDQIGDTPKALETFDAGIAAFPKAGELYLEAGGAHLDKNENTKALEYFEAGIKADPMFPSNYYWSAKLYCNSSERVYGLVYGELFVNLERNSERTVEISKLIFNTYKEGITTMPGSKPTVNFGDQNAVNIAKGTEVARTKLPFDLAYAPVLAMAAENETAVDINSLSRIRANFMINYYKLKMEVKYPNALLDYENKILKAGYFSAYSHWLLTHGDESGFNDWEHEHREDWNNFLHWFNANPIKLSEANLFYSGQYN